ncbi:MAG: DNA/RNA non-specific endonuclease [Kiritimatiellae bacterium]|nr:DNA/RNA non-specific endonuclease [Kiritimatiellia bacterium]MBQ7234099.1 DNA/RNA non-specific endonuclease [Kiritimatiellia bacterium]
MSARRKKRKKASAARRIALFALVVLVGGYAVLAATAVWFVHHPREWIKQKEESMPGFLVSALLWNGNGLGDITDALDITGTDSVYEYDEEAPSGSVFFAGAPKRTGDVQPADIKVLDRGEFAVGWSPSLRRPVWCAYHVTPDVLYQTGQRPNFSKDKEAANSPSPGDYTRSGYDRGHMVPNHAIESRYGADDQKKTFLMSNIAPQTPALNQGVWRNVEHRIADFWPAKYGEIWVIVGTIPNRRGETLSGTDIEIPGRFYQVIVAQEGMDVRALAVVFDQHVPWREWAARNIVSIDELEEEAGLDFLPDLPTFIQNPLEAETPSRLWPIRARDVFRLILLNLE